MDTYRRDVDFPQLTPVNSSNLRAVAYRADTATLWVEFHNGHLYQYSDVPGEAFQALMTADSIGAYFTLRIKPLYEGQQLR